MEGKFDENKPPVYEHIRPFRFVKPYEHEFRTYCKKRWIKRKLIDILTEEFKAYNKSYYLRTIENGKLTINDKLTKSDYIMRDNDLLVHKTLRVELPILDLDVKIINEDEDFLCVNKPPGVTIHTGGGYNYNTLLALMFFEYKKSNLFVLHRLDKCTSGVILFAKNKQTSLKFHEENSKFIMKKMYYARVQGDFDDKKFGIVDMPLVCLSYKDGIYSVYQKDKHEKDPLYNKDPPKQSQTEFKKMWYDELSKSSLLQCYPKTGRTHQIRIHLKYCGYPILNDTKYGGKFLGNLILKHKYGNEVYEQMMKGGKVIGPSSEEQTEELFQDKVIKKVKLNDGTAKQAQKEVPQNDQQAKQDECGWDFRTKSMEICLHSYTYQFEGKIFESLKPYWFEKNFSFK